MGLKPGVSGCMMLPTMKEVVMGRIGSGAQRSTCIGDVEDVLTLDIRLLRRLDVVRAGECVCNTVHWSKRTQRMPACRFERYRTRRYDDDHRRNAWWHH